MATTQLTVTATLYGATRKGASLSGNPIWILHTSEGDLRTQSDGQIGYTVTNHTGRHDSWIDKRVEFTTTSAGRVWDWELAE
jgi:hypothetical protein